MDVTDTITGTEGFNRLSVLLEQLFEFGITIGGRIVGAVLIFIIGRFLISLVKRLV